MKIIIKIILISLLFVNSCTLAFSQNKKPYLDSLNIRIENGMELFLATYDYATLGDSIGKDLKIFQDILKQNQADIPENTSFSMTYRPGNMLIIKQSVPVKRIVLQNNQHLKSFFNNQCNIIGNNYTLLIRFNNIDDLLLEDPVTKIKEALATLPEKNRLAHSYYFSYQENKLTHDKQLDKINGKTDFIDLKMGMGASLIKNQPVTDFSMELGYHLSKKGILKNNYYLSDNLIYLFDENQHINFYNFLNIGHRNNLSNEVGKKDWLGVEMGYLTTSNGDFFNKGTLKIGFNWGIGNSMSVATNFYLSNGLKNMYPGIRIGFGF